MKEYLLLDATKDINFDNQKDVLIRTKSNYKTYYFNVSKDNDFNHREGEYYTLVFNTYKNDISYNKIKKELHKVIKNIMNKYDCKGKTLIIGLGNDKIICDSFGPITGDKIIVSNHYNDFLTLPKVAVFNPKITAQTGISSYKLIKMVVKYLKPDLIIVIDSCITKDKNKIGRAIEINDAGIIRGENIFHNKSITKETFNIPVIAIMVPFIIEYNDCKYALPNEKNLVDFFSDLISDTINKIFFH